MKFSGIAQSHTFLSNVLVYLADAVAIMRVAGRLPRAMCQPRAPFYAAWQLAS